MKAGDTVRLIGVPASLTDYTEMQTRTLFAKCLGKTFVVIRMQSFEGVPLAMAELEVGDVLGEERSMHSIWVEPQYLQVESS